MMTVKHPDDCEREDRREGCPSWDVTIPVTVTVRGRNAADADHVARDVLEKALEETDAPIEIATGSRVRRHEEY